MLVMIIIISTCSDPPIEFSISVPNLSELGLSPNKPVVERSVSENEAERQNYRKLQLKMERRIKNREKLLAMKRFSGFLKRPEILGKKLDISCLLKGTEIFLQRLSTAWRRRNPNRNPRRRMMRRPRPTLRMRPRVDGRVTGSPPTRRSPP